MFSRFEKIGLVFAVLGVLGFILGCITAIYALATFLLEHLWNYVVVSGFHHTELRLSFGVTLAIMMLVSLVGSILGHAVKKSK